MALPANKTEYNNNNNNSTDDDNRHTVNELTSTAPTTTTTTTTPSTALEITDTKATLTTPPALADQTNYDISKLNQSNVQRRRPASVNATANQQDPQQQQQQLSTNTLATTTTFSGSNSPGLYTSTNGLPYGLYRNISLPPITAVTTTATTTTPTPTTATKSLPQSTTLQQQQQQPQHLSTPVYQQQNSQSTLTSTITPINDDKDDSKYKLFTIYGNDAGDNEKLGNLQRSTTGSLSSIITTSIASSEPDPGVQGGSGGGGGGGGGGHGGGSSAPDSSSIAGINGSSEEKLALNRPGVKQEKWTTVLLQVSIPFFLAGIGTIGAGIILGRVEKWYVFKNVSELFILVPALLGLKGNLDMCLASRLSTQVNLGNMTSRKEVIRMIVGNIALVQVQATVASFLVAMFAVSVGAAMNGPFMFEHVMLLTASAMFTATSSCFVLDFVLVAVILFSQKYRLNPDNLATPLAASIGDVVSISLLSFIASLLYDHIKTHLWITFIIVVCYLILLPMWVVIVLKNKYTRPVLKSGWVPVLSALCISGLGGLVLDAAVEVFKGFVVFQPIINGIGGNLVSVQASKISTMLHQSSIIGIIPPHTKIFEWPWRALFKGVPYATTARLLILMSIPGNIVFIFVADYIHMSASTVTVAFVLAYLLASLIQVMLLLYIAHIIVHTMWKWKVDPDNSSIPYLTALGDLLGSSLLALAFLFLLSIDQEYGADLNQLNASN